MARKKSQDLSDIFAKTEGDQPEPGDLDAGKIKSVSVGLSEGEIAALDALAEGLNVARNAIMRFGIRDFLLRYQAGKIELKTETKTKLKMP